MKQINVHEAKTHLSRWLEQAHNGEEIVIAKNGQPYARLVPLDTGGKRVLGFLRGAFEVTEAFFDPLSEDELGAWEGE